MAPVGLKHWMLHNDQLANEYDETLKLSPGYDPVRAVDPALTFHAPLLTGPDSIPGAIRATFERNSQATYWAPRGAFLLAAGDDESRHEYTPQDEPLGVLMEPAITNKCENYNANPDQALTNLSLISGSGSMVRVNRSEELRAAGLINICSDGNIVQIEGVTTYRIRAIGPTQNTNAHTLSVWARAVVGEGRLRYDNSDPSFTAFTNREFKRIVYTESPSASANWSIQAQPGAIVEFVLNQLEESEVASSVIVTEGAATSRAVDRLSYPLTGFFGSILNQAEGMAAIGFIPQFNSSDLPAITTNGYVLTLEGASFIRWQQNDLGIASFLITDGTTDANVNIAEGFIEGDLYLVMARYIGAAMQIGYKHVGNVTWAGEQAYDGAFAEDGLIWVGTGGAAPQPANYQHARLWNIDRGIQWLEDFFSEIAN